MEKVFPIYTRLYMPSWKKLDLDTNGRIRIDISDYENKKMIQIQKKKNAHLTICEFIMILMAEKTGIYFNIMGEKAHYLEPDTLRTLFNMIVLLDELKPYNAQNMKDEQEFRKLLFNFDVLKKDCLFRFASDLLSGVDTSSDAYTSSDDGKSSMGIEYEKFHEWQNLSIVLRSEQIVEWVSSQIKEMDMQKKNMKAVLWRTIEEPYCYAELIYCIYAMKHKIIKVSPEFSNCILYSYTLHMTEIYQKYLYYKSKITKNEYFRSNRIAEKTAEEKEDQAESINIVMARRYYNVLKDVMGTGICGRWAEYYFPQMLPQSQTSDAGKESSDNKQQKSTKSVM